MDWSSCCRPWRSPASRCREGSGCGIHLQWNIICDLPRETLEKCVRRLRVISCFYVSEALRDWEYGLDLAYTTDSFITREPLGFCTDGCAFPVCSTSSSSPCGSLRGLCERTYDLAGGQCQTHLFSINRCRTRTQAGLYLPHLAQPTLSPLNLKHIFH